MKIALVSKLWEETTPLSRGGTGASLGTLVNGLVEKGHKVTLFATGNSKTKAQRLISVRQKPYRGDYNEMHEYSNIATAFRRHKEFDIIHCAVEQKSVLFGGLVPTPSLHSIRYGEFFKDELNLLKSYKHLNFMGNSNAVKKYLPFLNWKGIVHNGVDISNFKFSNKTGDYLLFLGRLSPQKGIDMAIKVARRLNKRLLIAGKAVSADKEYLDKHVWPYVDGEKIVYLGEVWGKKKLKLFREAEAFLHPVNFLEACSNTVLESLASGTPVIATDNGGNKELIENNKSGFIVKNYSELLKAIKNITTIKREDCRKRVEDNFSATKMVDSYLELYEKIIKQK